MNSIKKQKRMGALEFKVIPIEKAPSPSVYLKRTPISDLYCQLLAIPIGKALEVSCPTVKKGYEILYRMKELAKKDKRILGESRNPDGITRYFWLENK